MKTYAWLSDTHFNFVSQEKFDQLCTYIKNSDAQALLLTGDIAESHDVVHWLHTLYKTLTLPIYFVLGNHDYYHASLIEVDQQIKQVCSTHTHLHWLDQCKPIKLNHSHALVGVGGWGDAQCGDFMNTPVRLNDHRLITDFKDLPRKTLEQMLQAKGRCMAEQLQQQLLQVVADESIQSIWVATHVPPFKESAWYEGKAGNINWIADFVCVSVGEVLLKFCQTYPQIQCKVFCGHAHSRGHVQMLPNLNVFTASARYKEPQVEQFLSI